MGVPQGRWMVYFMENPHRKWMMTSGSLLFLHIFNHHESSLVIINHHEKPPRHSPYFEVVFMETSISSCPLGPGEAEPGGSSLLHRPGARLWPGKKMAMGLRNPGPSAKPWGYHGG